MTFHGLFSRVPARRASSLYHLGMELTYEAKIVEAQFGLRPDQAHALNIFLGEVRKAHNRLLEEMGYEAH